jgi:bifunctional non-homologous end joining protein LigD
MADVDRPTLPFEVDVAPPTLPRHLAPMQARLAAGAFNSADHLFEVKWDGVRALVARDDRGLRIWDRRGTDLLSRLPELGSIAHQLPEGVLLDAEVVVCDARGRPRYELIAGRLGPKSRKTGRGPLVLAFDLLYDDYRPLLGRPLEERRARLAGALLGLAASSCQSTSSTMGNRFSKPSWSMTSRA